MKISELKKRLENVFETQGDTDVIYINLNDSKIYDINNLTVITNSDGRFMVSLSEKEI